MSNMKLTQYVVGPISTNCYFITNEDTKETIIVDPGDEAAMLSDRITISNLKPVGILLTHGHFDHTIAAGDLSEEYGIKIYAGKDEKETLEDPRINRSSFGDRITASYKADVFLEDNEIIKLAGFDIKVIFTPRHTPGGVCYYIEDEGTGVDSFLRRYTILQFCRQD